eukprot:gene36367-biopygen3555
MSLETDMRPGDVKMRSNGEVEESPEEMETPVPVSFGPVSAFRESSYEEAKIEYYELLKGRVGEMLSGSVEFNEVLRSSLAVNRFVPKEWTGIQGFPPLELQVKEDFPPFHKVRSRPVVQQTIR